MSIDPADPAHGVALTDCVLARIRRDPDASVLPYADVPWVVGRPAPLPPEVLADTTFPSGRPLPPSLRAWLAFDSGLLRRYGWFDASGTLTPRPLHRIVADEMGAWWEAEFRPFAGRFGECFLLPGGSDSRRVLAVGEPDSTGEYPVLALDFDDLPFVGLMYPGFDVYLAHTAGLLDREFTGYSVLADDPVYGRRMREHARIRFAGRLCEQFPFAHS
ncbi:hypothetical protein ABZV91_08155 [Nocardia sp. NPDC004568]|uniref:hypothetical protein n=1 Tax=Nocardia sp. NPDC004568 TaxID=3154551 RepID=UPI0033AA3DA4